MTGLLQRTVERLRGARGPEFSYPQPVVIFGTGGSGTRALQILTDHSGYYMGANFNRAVGQLREYLAGSHLAPNVLRFHRPPPAT